MCKQRTFSRTMRVCLCLTECIRASHENDKNTLAALDVAIFSTCYYAASVPSFLLLPFFLQSTHCKLIFVFRYRKGNTSVRLLSPITDTLLLMSLFFICYCFCLCYYFYYCSIFEICRPFEMKMEDAEKGEREDGNAARAITARIIP